MRSIIPHSKPYVSKEDIGAVSKQVKSGMHSSGKKVKKFENKFVNYIGSNYAKATSSGTTALHLALLSLNVKKGDEVIIPSYVCSSVMSAVNMTGAIPVLADIQDNFLEKGYNISGEKINNLINKKTKAIIVPHMFGIPADLESIIKVAGKIPIIEDCAHSLGAKYNGEMTGTIGDIGIFSFYATKLISTGQGGMITTNSEKLFDKITDLTKYDERKEYRVSYNYSMSDIQAALGISQLSKLDFFIERRTEICKIYDSAIDKSSLRKINRPDESYPFRYIVLTESLYQKENVKSLLLSNNIISENPIYNPLHRYLGLDSEKFPNTEKAFQQSLSVPLYPALTDKEVDYISNVLLKL